MRIFGAREQPVARRGEASGRGQLDLLATFITLEIENTQKKASIYPAEMLVS